MTLECKLCLANSGLHREAEFCAAQSEDQGVTVTWLAICASHADGWNDGSDWDAPVIPLTQPQSNQAQ